MSFKTKTTTGGTFGPAEPPPKHPDAESTPQPSEPVESPEQDDNE